MSVASFPAGDCGRAPHDGADVLARATGREAGRPAAPREAERQAAPREAERQRAQREAERQMSLVQSLWSAGAPPPAAGWQGPPARVAAGLAAYRANGAAVAARALGAAFPTVRQLLGDEDFAAFARAFWRAHPPRRGDLAEYGAALPGFIAADPAFAALPYLADSALLDWQVHRAEAAADGAAAPAGLERLGDTDPAQLHLLLRPGCALLRSRWPVATIHAAHADRRPPGGEDRFAAARAALARGEAENAWVARAGWRAEVSVLDDPSAAFAAALLAGRPLAAALDEAGDGFDFEGWLILALQRGWLVGVAVDGAAR